MFSGIIQNRGKIIDVKKSAKGLSFDIQTTLVAGLKKGDSVAVNGVCLTVTRKFLDNFSVDVMQESLQRTNLGQMKINDPVNLESSLTVNGKIDGHIVQGHVDFCTKLIKKINNGNSVKMIFKLPKKYQEYLVEKGSVAVNGVSLTVVNVTNDSFEVDIIPFTQNVTNLNDLKVDDTVNIETDILGKYIVRQLSLRKDSTNGFDK